MYVLYYAGYAIASNEHPHFAMQSAVIEQQTNAADSFTFTLPANHPNRDTPQPRQGVVRVKQDNKTLFVGDIIEVKTAFDNSRTFICQGCLAWLEDICCPKLTAAETVSNAFENRLKTYNSLCSAKRKISAGNCENKAASTVKILTPDSFITVFDYFKELLSRKGGLLLPRYEQNTTYLDYLSSKSRTSRQQIVFGQNLLNLDDYISATGTATAIYPMGKDGITISGVNPTGKNYIINSPMYQKYGMIAVPAKYEAETAQELLSEAKLTLSSLAVLNRTIELTAFDLSRIDINADEIEIGDTVRVISAPHGLDTSMTCTAKTTDLIDPAQSTISLGKKRRVLSDIVSVYA